MNGNAPFAENLVQQIKKKNSALVVGIDPRLEAMPEEIRRDILEESPPSMRKAEKALRVFSEGIIDAVADTVPAIKPQVAFYETYGWEGYRAYCAAVDYARKKGLIVIGDVKRGDIGPTVDAYQSGHLGWPEYFYPWREKIVARQKYIERLDRSTLPNDEKLIRLAQAYHELTYALLNLSKSLKRKLPRFLPGSKADAVTANPYFGHDGISRLMTIAWILDKGVFVLVRTSNPSAVEIQDVVCGDQKLFEKVAELVDQWGSEYICPCGYSSLGAVVAATYPSDLVRLREIMPKTIFLLPGIGPQGGKIEDLSCCFDENGLGAVVAAAREIDYAFAQPEFKDLSRRLGWTACVTAAAKKLNDQINAVRFG